MGTKLSINELRQIIRDTLKEDVYPRKTVSLEPQSQGKKVESGKKQYAQLFFEYTLAKDVFRGSLNEQSNPIVDLINNGDWEPQNAASFMKSLYSSKRKQFLSPYSESEFSSMRLFKLKQYSIGFAIKSDGDIIAVHNNEPYGGLGPALMAAAITNNGTKLDHFDGFLTGLYKKNGFPNVVNRDEWNEEYAPNGWEYEPIDIFSPNLSAYAELPEFQKLASNPKAITNIEKNYQIPIDDVRIMRNYKFGRPSIIYRAR